MAPLHCALTWEPTGSANRREKCGFDPRRSTHCKDIFRIPWLHLNQAVGFKIRGSRVLCLSLKKTVSYCFTFECNLSPRWGREDLRLWLQHFRSVQPLAHILKPGDREKVLFRDGEKRWGRPMHAGNHNSFVQPEASQQRPSNMVTSCKVSKVNPTALLLVRLLCKQF